MARNRIRRQACTHAKEASLLAGLLHDEAGQRLTPSHATKGKRRYRYYVTAKSGHETGDNPPWRIPASEIEELVRNEILGLLRSLTRLDQTLGLTAIATKKRLALYQAARARADALEEAHPAALRPFLLAVIQRITISSQAIEIAIHAAQLMAEIRGKKEDLSVHSLLIVSLGVLH